jgi:hypothetical protein
VARYDGLGNGDDVATALAVDTSGNVYVTGWSWGGTITEYDYATIKYDANGNQLWVARYNYILFPPQGTIERISVDTPYSLAVDTSGNVYVAGSSVGLFYCLGTECWVETDYATIKYDASGNQVWVARYNGPGGFGDDVASALALDSSDNVYVTGGSEREFQRYDYLTIKYIQVPTPPPWGAAQIAEASALSSNSSHSSYVVNYSSILLIPLFLVILRKASYRKNSKAGYEVSTKSK